MKAERIADEIKRRIVAGQLRSGARAPSTRAVARRWSVSTATAARALRLLREQGLVIALPRSGTVVAGRPAGVELSRDRIIIAALRIADDEGIAALSIRGVASKLGTSPMSLYRHVQSKEELVTEMADAALGEVPLPDAPLTGWRAQIEAAARVEWKVMRRHPWLARVISVGRPHPLPNALAFVNWVMRALEDTALDEPGKLQLHVIVHSFIQGLAVNVEAEAQAAGETGISEAEHMRAQEARFAALAASGRYPYFAKLTEGLPKSFEIDMDVLFELGLTAVLDGVARKVDSIPPHRGKRRSGRPFAGR